MSKIIPIPGLLLAAALAFLAAPGSQIAASDCGSNDGEMCWENESCFNVLFYRQCTTNYKYYEGE
ncbi:MAG: hypothetical protein WD995_00190 [Gemmatimonadota bacterium]